MKLLVSFDPNEDLIYLTATIIGPKASRNVRLAFDTGAAYTMIHSKDMTAIGYDLNRFNENASIVTGSAG